MSPTRSFPSSFFTVLASRKWYLRRVVDLVLACESSRQRQVVNQLDLLMYKGLKEDVSYGVALCLGCHRMHGIITVTSRL